MVRSWGVLTVSADIRRVAARDSDSAIGRVVAIDRNLAAFGRDAVDVDDAFSPCRTHEPGRGSVVHTDRDKAEDMAKLARTVAPMQP